jgi:serine/threonine-protein kinase
VTTPGTILGTVGYMSAEQARGYAADARSDIFSGGAVMHELFSGHHAFDGPTPADVLSANSQKRSAGASLHPAGRGPADRRAVPGEGPGAAVSVYSGSDVCAGGRSRIVGNRCCFP